QRRRLPVVRALSTRVKQFTPVRALRRKRYERLFANTKTWRGLQHGLYRSFAEARRAAPRALPTGYILEDERFFAGARLETYDYPVMLWLAQLLPGAHRLFDFGGHV